MQIFQKDQRVRSKIRRNGELPWAGDTALDARRDNDVGVVTNEVLGSEGKAYFVKHGDEYWSDAYWEFELEPIKE